MITLEQLEIQMWTLSDIDIMLEKFLDERRLLQKSDITLRISDFDYTIFSRDDQLEQDEMLRKKRWDEWSKYILYYMGLDKYIDTHIRGKDFPKDIVDLLDKETDIILTAGIEKLQRAKIWALWLDKYRVIVTSNGQEKILACIRYVLYELKTLPKEIVIYEDRPEYFIQYKSLIEWVLGCKLTIVQVEMDGNKWYKLLEEV